MFPLFRRKAAVAEPTPSTPPAAPGAGDWTDPGHRLTEAELDAALKTYHDCRSRYAKSGASVRIALEEVIRGFLASQAPILSPGPRPGMDQDEAGHWLARPFTTPKQTRSWPS